jgi:hypothetical protein
LPPASIATIVACLPTAAGAAFIALLIISASVGAAAVAFAAAVDAGLDVSAPEKDPNIVAAIPNISARIVCLASIVLLPSM